MKSKLRYSQVPIPHTQGRVQHKCEDTSYLAQAMLYNITSPKSAVLKNIAKEVGSADIQAKSSEFMITSASSEIYGMLDVSIDLPRCNLELRHKGMILHFQSKGQGYAWAVPYWRLHIQHNDGKLSLFAGEHHIRLQNQDGSSIDREYVAGLYERIAASTGQDHDIYGGHP